MRAVVIDTEMCENGDAMMKIAVAQVDCSPGEVALNCSRIGHWAARAKEWECQVLVLPELVDTGYEMNAVLRHAGLWPGAAFGAAGQAAQDFAMYVMCGLSERDGEKVYNSLAVFDPSGRLVAKYRKTHLFSLDPVRENLYLAAGDSLVTAEIGGMTWGFQICYDIRFPEVSRYLVARGCEVLVVCAAWPDKRALQWNYLTVARAIESQAYLIGANRVGTDGSVTFCGSSRIIDPRGIQVALSPRNGEDLIVGEVSADVVSGLRESQPILDDRREDLYRSWQQARS